MKIRVMGDKRECEWAQEFFRQLEEEEGGEVTVTISDLYLNRGSRTSYRVYIDINPANMTLPRFGGRNE